MSDEYHQHKCQLCDWDSDCFSRTPNCRKDKWCDSCRHAIDDLGRAESYAFMKLYELIDKLRKKIG